MIIKVAVWATQRANVPWPAVLGRKVTGQLSSPRHHTLQMIKCLNHLTVYFNSLKLKILINILDDVLDINLDVLFVGYRAESSLSPILHGTFCFILNIF